jgi:hypothetical protein
MKKTAVYRVGLGCFVGLVGVLSLGWAAAPETSGTQAVAAAAAEGPGGQPRIQFGTLEHDFGQAASGQDLKTVFEFKNVGDDVLVIDRVKGG